MSLSKSKCLYSNNCLHFKTVAATVTVANLANQMSLDNKLVYDYYMSFHKIDVINEYLHTKTHT